MLRLEDPTEFADTAHPLGTNFVGSGVLDTVGVVTLTKVKHRRELLFEALPVLFARISFSAAVK